MCVCVCEGREGVKRRSFLFLWGKAYALSVIYLLANTVMWFSDLSTRLADLFYSSSWHFFFSSLCPSFVVHLYCVFRAVVSFAGTCCSFSVLQLSLLPSSVPFLSCLALRTPHGEMETNYNCPCDLLFHCGATKALAIDKKALSSVCAAVARKEEGERERERDTCDLTEPMRSIDAK